MKKESRFSAIRGFLFFVFWMLIFGLAVRFFEAGLLGYYRGLFWKQLSLCMKGFCYDVLLFSKVALVLCVLYLIIHHFSSGAAKWTFRVVGSLLLLVSNAMVMYFVSATIPLDKVFFDYSIKEVIYISQSTGAFVWWGYVGLLLIPALFFIVSGNEMRRVKPMLFIWLVLAVVGFFVKGVPAWTCNNREEKYTVCNKQEFFWRSLFKKEAHFSRFNEKDIESQRDRVEDFQSNFPENEFVDFRYPFAHIDKSPDVLSEYFDMNPDQKPNFVFIITEGLSREFSGYNSRFPSATPFLDSLAEQGLNWLNCMSSSQRTIAVLPSVFGSLPFGKRGFMQSPNSPRFQSLVNILKDNGYVTSFFYGGWVCFDDMCYFLNDLGIDNYLPDHNSFPENVQSTWGLYDETMFSEALKMVADQGVSPRLDIYLTLTTHDPFDYPDKEHYTKVYSDKLVQYHQEHNIPQYQYEQYASYLYYDDCLKKFLTDYRSVPGYENTIFVITGDHCFNGQSEELDKYHVPLIIWSPMLKEARRFPAMVAHRDITPSFLAFMKNNYDISSPTVVSWINTGLDTSPTFQANTFTPQLKNSRKMDNMVYKEFFYDEGAVYKFAYENDKLTVTPVKNDQIVDFMGEYKAMDDYVMNNNALLKMNGEKQWLLLSVDSLQCMDYVKPRSVRSQHSSIETLDKKNIVHLDGKYPFNLFQQTLSDTLESVAIYCDFDIYIPNIEDGKKIYIDMAFQRQFGTKNLLRSLMINYDWYEYYDKWHHYSMSQVVNKSQLQYLNDDLLKCYFSNGGEKDFYVKNFNLKIIGNAE
ncbi:MAG: LTA synthase family protein [Candidatus Limimorpha sp.]